MLNIGKLLPKIRIGVVALVAIICCLFILISPSRAKTTDSSTDLNLSISEVVGISINNCSGLPDADSSSITLTPSPSINGTFASNCQTITAYANTPGYQLLAKSSSTNLTYQNPTSLSPKPVIPSTSGTLNSPTTLSNNTWGFAIENQLNYDTSYTANNASNKYSTLPTTDTEIYSTDELSTGDTFRAFYGTKINMDTLAGTYQTTITYTVIGEEVPEVPLKFKEITEGVAHTCAIASNDNAYCWGDNEYGQLGDGTNTSSNTPVKVANTGVLNGLTIKQISTISYHTCAIASDDNAYCWGGLDNVGELGDGANTNSNVPVKVDNTGVLAGLTIKQISAGIDYTCAVASNNNTYCWGSNRYGQLGNGTNTDSKIPVKVDNTGVLAGLTIKQISADGGYIACVVASDNNAYCWGWNNYGQLGNNTNTNSNVPVKVDNTGVLAGLTIKQISAGTRTCVVASDNNAYCWGRNGDGQLGNGTNTDSKIPVKVDNTGVLAGLTIKQISAGISHTCVVASNNNAYCWGWNGNGVLGIGNTTNSKIPVKVDNTGVLAGLTIKQISASFYNTCVIASNNNAYCWGRNNNGQLGNGNNTYSYTPVKVINPTP